MSTKFWANVYPTVEMIKQKVNRRENINNKKDIKMRKKILSAAFAVAIMAAAGYNVYMIQTKGNLSELALANIEALADDYPEGGEVITCGTKEKPYSPTPCVKCGCKSGMDGIFYSKTTGNDTSYKYGFERKQLYCCCNGLPTLYSKADPRKCSE